jgi:hypothetical protein
VDDEHRRRVPVEPRAHGAAEPPAPCGLADDHEVPAASLGLPAKRRRRLTAGDELGHGDLGGDERGGGLDALLRPVDHLVAELRAAGGRNDGTGGDDQRRLGGAGEKPDPAVPIGGQLDGTLERAPGGGAVIDSDKYPVEHCRSLSL